MKAYVGIDIGGTNTKIAIVDPFGKYSDLSRVYYDAAKLSIESFLEKATGVVDDLVNANKESVEGIGISCPGLQMDNGHGTLRSANMPVLNEFDLKLFFENRFKLPVTVSNDLVAHSLAESIFGLGKGVDRFLSVSMGTGIGHAFIYKGKPQLIINGTSGDSGRIIIEPDSDITNSTGVSGSAEALCGVKAIEMLGQNYYSLKKKHTAQEIITKAREESDPVAIEIMLVISRRLAVFLIDLSAIYFPDIISITGGQTEAGSFFVEECQKEFDRRAFGFFKDIRTLCGKEQKIIIQKSETGGLTGLIGSVVPLMI